MVYYTLGFKQSTRLDDPGLLPGSLILIQSSLLNATPSPSPEGGIDNTSFNLYNAAGDTLLHISIRRKENEIVFNSRKKDGNWGTEERDGLAGRFTSKTPSILIYEHPDRYQVLFDFQTVRYFKKRIEGPTREVGYGANENQTSAFSPQVGVNTYKSLANLVGGPV